MELAYAEPKIRGTNDEMEDMLIIKPRVGTRSGVNVLVRAITLKRLVS